MLHTYIISYCSRKSMHKNADTTFDEMRIEAVSAQDAWFILTNNLAAGTPIYATIINIRMDHNSEPKFEPGM